MTKNENLRILGIDIGSHTGLFDGEHATTLEFTGLRHEKMMQLHRQLTSYMSSRPFFDVVIFERPFNRGLGATRMLWGMAGVVEAVGTEQGAAVVDQLSGPIKKWATGYGGSGKDPMIAAAKKIYSGLIMNDHEADAICIHRYADEVIGVTK